VWQDSRDIRREESERRAARHCRIGEAGGLAALGIAQGLRLSTECIWRSVRRLRETRWHGSDYARLRCWGPEFNFTKRMSHRTAPHHASRYAP
jgi:hypothetical protein